MQTLATVAAKLTAAAFIPRESEHYGAILIPQNKAVVFQFRNSLTSVLSVGIVIL